MKKAARARKFRTNINANYQYNLLSGAEPNAALCERQSSPHPVTGHWAVCGAIRRVL
jgi:hypothetical protein